MSIVIVPLSQGKVAVIDAEDAEIVLAFKWSAVKSVSTSGRVTWYAQRNVNSGNGITSILLHRFLMDAQPGVLVDHEDHDGLNCRRSNMRFATHSQNQHNRRKTISPTTSKYLGVSGREGAWKAQITIDGVTRLLGIYVYEETAARAYDHAAKSLRGEFLSLNFPDAKKWARQFFENTSFAAPAVGGVIILTPFFEEDNEWVEVAITGNSTSVAVKVDMDQLDKLIEHLKSCREGRRSAA